MRLPTGRNEAAPSSKINECPRGRSKQFRAHSKGEPDAPGRKQINVRFAIALPVEIEIKPFAKTGPGGFTELTGTTVDFTEELCEK